MELRNSIKRIREQPRKFLSILFWNFVFFIVVLASLRYGSTLLPSLEKYSLTDFVMHFFLVLAIFYFLIPFLVYTANKFFVYTFYFETKTSFEHFSFFAKQSAKFFGALFVIVLFFLLMMTLFSRESVRYLSVIFSILLGFVGYGYSNLFFIRTYHKKKYAVQFWNVKWHILLLLVLDTLFIATGLILLAILAWLFIQVGGLTLLQEWYNLLFVLLFFILFVVAASFNQVWFLQVEELHEE